MTNEEIRLSDWALEMYIDQPDVYEYAIEMALNPWFKVLVYKSYDLGDNPVWAIESALEPGFWMSAKDTKKEALALCKEMKWKVNNKGKHKNETNYS